jgi:prolyl-tRNA synthetase
VIGPRGLANGKAEIKNRQTGQREEMPLEGVAQRFAAAGTPGA